MKVAAALMSHLYDDGHLSRESYQHSRKPVACGVQYGDWVPQKQASFAADAMHANRRKKALTCID